MNPGLSRFTDHSSVRQTTFPSVDQAHSLQRNGIPGEAPPKITLHFSKPPIRTNPSSEDELTPDPEDDDDEDAEGEDEEAVDLGGGYGDRRLVSRFDSEMVW